MLVTYCTQTCSSSKKPCMIENGGQPTHLKASICHNEHQILSSLCIWSRNLTLHFCSDAGAPAPFHHPAQVIPHPPSRDDPSPRDQLLAMWTMSGHQKNERRWVSHSLGERQQSPSVLPIWWPPTFIPPPISPSLLSLLPTHVDGPFYVKLPSHSTSSFVRRWFAKTNFHLPSLSTTPD